MSKNIKINYQFSMVKELFGNNWQGIIRCEYLWKLILPVFEEEVPFDMTDMTV